MVSTITLSVSYYNNGETTSKPAHQLAVYTAHAQFPEGLHFSAFHNNYYHSKNTLFLTLYLCASLSERLKTATNIDLKTSFTHQTPPSPWGELLCIHVKENFTNT